MMAWLLLGCGALLLAAAAHPFLTYAPSLAVLARLRPRPIGYDREWRPAGLAVCVCAYNEAANIAARVENLLLARAEFPTLDILVYVDGATDGTLAALAPYRDRIRVLASASRQGKSFGMNRLVESTDAEIVVFSDANVSFAPGAMARLAEPFADPAVGCVCGHLRYSAADSGGAAAEVGSRYWQLEERIKALESATGSVMGADGSIFAIRRALHVPPPADLIDDMFVSFHVLLQGFRIVRQAEALASEPPVASAREEVRRKIRIACQAMNVHRALWPQLRRLPAFELYKYVSHKLIRWVSIYLLALGAACVLVGLALAGASTTAALLLALAAPGAFVLAGAKSGPLGALRNILLALTATGIGVAESFRGARFQTWTPPATARRADSRPLALQLGKGD